MRCAGHWCRFVLFCLGALLALPAYAAARHISIDTGECGGELTVKDSAIKSTLYTDEARGLRAYGVLVYRHAAEDAKNNRCHVEFRIFVAVKGGDFDLVKSRVYDTEGGEIAGIDLIGVSPDGSKFAADTWLAEGDGQGHWPIVYDPAKKLVLDRDLAGKIQDRHRGCYQVEDFIGVTNKGEAIFAVPPSDDDSPECGDKGLWHFNLQTGRVIRVARISGDKWN